MSVVTELVGVRPVEGTDVPDGRRQVGGERSAELEQPLTLAVTARKAAGVAAVALFVGLVPELVPGDGIDPVEDPDVQQHVELVPEIFEIVAVAGNRILTVELIAE